MLTVITLENFKSYQEARLTLAPLTVLIGANASGKSNALEGMRLLSWLAQGQKLSTIQYHVHSGNRVVRGTVDDLSYQGSNVFSIGAETDRTDFNILNVKFESRDDGLHISSEKLSSKSGGVPLYVVETPSFKNGTDCSVAYNNFLKGRNKPRVICSDQQAIFTQLTSPATFAATHKQSRDTIPSIAKELESWLSGMLFLDPAPTVMREYSFPSEKTLYGDGKNISAVLYDLWGANRDKKIEETNGHVEPYKTQRESILSFIQSLPEQDISSLSFLEEPRGGVMVQLTETFGGKSRDVNASLLSDGTLRVLSIAAAMLSAPEGNLVVIEEIDNGVHPSRARRLLDNIRTIAERRKLRVLLSTHNPAMLDALPDAALPDVHFCYRDPQGGFSRVVRLRDLPDYPEIISQDTLGGLVTTGTLERFVKQPLGDDRIAKALAWLEKMQKDAE